MVTWYRAKPKKGILARFKIPDDGLTIINYREAGKEIYIRYTYMQTTIPKADMKHYLEPLKENGELVACPQDVSDSLENSFKKIFKS